MGGYHLRLREREIQVKRTEKSLAGYLGVEGILAPGEVEAFIALIRSAIDDPVRRLDLF